jgi:hypothetical protein
VEKLNGYANKRMVNLNFVRAGEQVSKNWLFDDNESVGVKTSGFFD